MANRNTTNMDLATLDKIAKQEYKDLQALDADIAKIKDPAIKQVLTETRASIKEAQKAVLAVQGSAHRMGADFDANSIGVDIMNKANGSSFGYTMQAYREYVESLKENFSEQALKRINAEMKNAKSSEVDKTSGIQAINNIIAEEAKKSAKRAKILAEKTRKELASGANIRERKPMSPQEIRDALPPSIKKSLNIVHGNKIDGTEVLGSRYDAQRAIDQIFKEIENQGLMVVGQTVDPKTNNVKLVVARKDDLETPTEQLPTIDLYLADGNVIGGKEKGKINDMVAINYQGTTNFVPRNVAHMLKMAQNIKYAKNYQDLKRSVKTTKKIINKGVQSFDEFRSSKASNARANATKAFQVDLFSEYFPSLLRKKGGGNQFEYQAMYNLLTRVLQVDDLKLLQKIVTDSKNDKSFDDINKIEGLFGDIVSEFMNLRKLGVRIIPGGTSENSFNTGKIALQSTRLVSNALDSFLSEGQRQQGLATVNQKQNRSARKNIFNTSLAKKMGLSKEDGNAVKTLYTSESAVAKGLADYNKKYGTNYDFSIREGGLLIDKDLMADLSSNSRDFQETFSRKAIAELIEKQWGHTQEQFLALTEATRQNILQQAITRYAQEQGVRATNLSWQYDQNSDSYLVNGQENLEVKRGAKIVGASANTRATVADLNEEQKLYIYAAAIGKDYDKLTKKDKERAASFHAIAESEAIDQRNAGRQIKSYLNDIGSSKGAKGFMRMLSEDAGLGDKGAEALSKMFHLEGNEIITDDIDRVLDEYNKAGENIHGLILTYLDKKSKMINGVARNFAEDGSYNSDATYVGADNYRVHDAPTFGEFSNKGSAAMSSGYDSLTRKMGVLVGAGVISSEQAKDFLATAREQMLPTEAETATYKQAQARAQQALDLSGTSGNTGFKGAGAAEISIGYGSGYDVDLDRVEEEVWKDGYIANWDKTLEGQVDAIAQQKVKDGVIASTEEALPYIVADFVQRVVYDNGNGKKTDRTYAGNRVYLTRRNIAGKDEFVSNREVQALASAVKRQDSLDRVSDAAAAVLGGQYDAVNNKNGSIYQDYHHKKTPNSMYAKLVMSNAKINWSEGENDVYGNFLNDIAQSGMQVSRDDALKMLDTLSNKDLKAYYKDMFGESSGKLKKAQIQDKILNALTLGTDENRAYLERLGDNAKGLLMGTGRFPLINGLDLKGMGAFISSNLEGGTVELGYKIAKEMNADVDGDKIAAFFLGKLPKEQQETVARLIEFEMRLAKSQKAGSEGSEIKNLNDSPYDRELDRLASNATKINKESLGKYSYLSRTFRNYSKIKGLDEEALIDNGGSPEAIKNAISAEISRTFFEAMEQDTISAKKVIKRMAKVKGTSIEGAEWEALSEEERQGRINDLYYEAMTSVGSLFEDWKNGKDFKEVLTSLQDMGVLEADSNGLLKGRVAEHALGLAEQFLNHGKIKGTDREEIIRKIFGNEENFKNSLKSGTISQSALETSLKIQGSPVSNGDINKFINHLFWNKAQYSPETVSYASNLGYRAGGETEKVFANATPEVKESIKNYNLLRKTLDRTSDSYDDEIKREQLKTTVANNEAKAIGNLAGQYEKLNGNLADILEPGEFERATQIAGRTYTPGAFVGSNKINKIIGDLLSSSSEEAFREISALKNGNNAFRAKLLGFDSEKDFVKAARASLSTNKGNIAHSVAQGLLPLDQKALLELENSLTVDNALEKVLGSISDEGIKQELESLVSRLTEQMSMLGIGNIQPVLYQTLYKGIHGKRLESKVNPNTDIKSAEQTFYSFGKDGQKVKGTLDLFSIAKDPATGRSVFKIGDYKNQEGAPRTGNLAQIFEYFDMVQEALNSIQKAKKQGMLSETWRQKYNKKGGWKGNDLSSDLVEALWSVNPAAGIDFEGTFFGNHENGSSTAYSVDYWTGKYYYDLFKSRGGSLTEAEKKAWERTARTTETLEENPNYVAQLQKAGYDIKSSEQRAKEAEAEQRSNERLSEYIQLLKEEYKLKAQIYKLNLEIASKESRGENTDAEQVDLEILKSQVEYENRIRGQIAEEGFNSSEQDKINAAARSAARTAIYTNKKSKTSNTYDDIELDEKSYKQLLNQRLSYERKIENARAVIKTTTLNREKDAQQRIVDLSNEQIESIDTQIEALQKRGLIRKDEVKNIENEYLIAQEEMRLMAGAKNHGARNVWDMIGNDIKRSFTRVLDYGVAYKAINKLQARIRQIYQDTIKLNTAMTNIRIVTGSNEKAATSLIKTYNQLAQTLGVTTEQVANGANEWLRQGYAINDTNKLIEASTKLAVLGMTDTSSATQYLTAIMKGFKLEVADAMGIVDKLTAVDMAASVSASGIAEALSRTSVSAQLAGVEIDKLIGMVSTIGEVTQKDMSSVGEAMKTLFARYGNVKTGAFSSLLGESDETTEGLNDIEKVMKAIGISVRSSVMEFREMDDVLDDLAEKWINLSTVEKNAVATAFGGTRQRENFNVLMENYEKYQELTEQSASSSGTANEKWRAQVDSITYSMNKITAAWEEIVLKLNASPFIKTMGDISAWLIKILPRTLGVASTFITGMMSFRLNTDLKKLVEAFSISKSSIFHRPEVVEGGKRSSLFSIKGQTEKANEYAQYEAQKIGKLELISQKIEEGTNRTVAAIKGTPEKSKGEGTGTQNGTTPDATSKKLKKISTASVRAAAALSGGITGALTGALTTEGTIGDKALGAAVTGGLAAVGNALLPGIGGTIGSIVGQFITPHLLNIIHQQELAEKARVEAAQKQLEALNSIASQVSESEELVRKDKNEWTSEDYAAYRKLITPIIESLTTTNKILGENLDFDLLKEGNQEEFLKFQQAFYDKQADEYLASQETNLRELREQRETAYNSNDNEEVKRVERAIQNIVDKADVFRITGAITSALGTKSKIDIKKMTLQDAVEEIAKVLGLDGADALTSSQTREIRSQLRANSLYSNLFNNGLYTFKELLGKGEDVSGFAHTLGLTVEQAEKLEDVLGNLTSVDAAKNITELTERYKAFGTVLSDLTEDGQLSYENLTKVAKDFPFLMEGEEGDYGQEYITGNIVKALTGEMPQAMAGVVSSQYGNDAELFETFKRFYDSNGELEGYDSFNLADSNGAIGKEWRNKWKKFVSEHLSTSELFAGLTSKLTEYSNKYYENEISNLQSIKDNLDSVNQRREKELNLIKAKDALENARNTKKLVYREGVGFTYQTDQQAVQEAQEKYEQLQNDLTKENLQYQIDQLNTQKDILTAIQEAPKWEQINQLYEAWTKGTGITGGPLGALGGWLEDEGPKKALTNLVNEYVDNAGDVRFEVKNTARNNFKESYNSLQNWMAKNEFDLETQKGDDLTYEEALKNIVFNAKLKDLQEARDKYLEAGGTNKDLEKIDKGVKDVLNLEALSQRGYVTTKSTGSQGDIVLGGENALPEYMNSRSKKNKIYFNDVSNLTSDLTQSSDYSPFIDHFAYIRIQNSKTGEWGRKRFKDEQEAANYVSSLPNFSTIYDIHGVQDSAYMVIDGKMYRFSAEDLQGQSNGYIQAEASGTTSFSGGPALINELGTEAIVTPYGTMTSLPSKTGIVPADLTKNIFTLGEVAPNLIRALDSQKQGNYSKNSSVEDNSINIQQLTANFKAEENFDFDEFLTDVKSTIALNTHNK